MEMLKTALGEFPTIASERLARIKGYRIFAVQENPDGSNRIVIYEKPEDKSDKVALLWVEPKCPFFEIDLELQEMVEAEERDERQRMGDEAYEKMVKEMEDLYAKDNPEPHPEILEQCWQCCKWYREHSGYPGENLRCCSHPDNAQILEASQDPF